MNIISISMITGDAQGAVVMKEGMTTYGEQPARVSRLATLDGRAEIIHSGVSDGDRTFQIKTKINSKQKTLIEYIHRNSTLVMLSCSDGLFLGAISTMNTAKTPFTMTFLVKEKLA